MHINRYITRQIIIILTSTLFLLCFENIALWTRLLETYPINSSNQVLHITALILFFSCSTLLFMLWVSQGNIGKFILATILITSSLSAYYMDSFGVVVDVEMIRNIIETNPGEISGLLNMSMVLKFIVLGLIPATLVIMLWPKSSPGVASEFSARLKISLILIIVIIGSVAAAPANFASFVREHKITRLYANPTGWIYSTIDFIQRQVRTSRINHPLQDTAVDAKIVEDHDIKELIVLVVGETARADRFSLNGYDRPTNPELSKRGVISFPNVTSCGTSTGVSVPCMFSALGRKNFTSEEAKYYKNALDVLFETGVQVIWRDNNSDSKGVATRVQYENFRSPTNNPLCDRECRDIGMLHDLDKYIAARKGKDILIVLHQMGNHGPEYYRRYPDAFEYFKPTCKSGELGNCTTEEINNAYDNAIRYTDYFLSKTIDFLKKYDKTHATAMLYVSDHGESLGEHGIYLHAAPYAIAPTEQTHVPAILWTGRQFDYPASMIQPYSTTALSHDDLFCSLLIAFEVKTTTCELKEQWLELNPRSSESIFNNPSDSH
ncbi:lipid A ethanolaminephosphotransferase [Methylobacillus rhizosphaerae]|uniref:Lipid A ethanolaminephosphotransferase n=1 Tax=Methylobacillus rhizosphaerae TaxID=551994 RepID=A0A239AE89_9PROT|nr:phosphoethanolamine--lipid A transferase [Methylobacillus rhizosphaerae]SNR93671.1 lipid A ethanolaminephosphotransferase [Methylobacillus rhizosphaerae]